MNDEETLEDETEETEETDDLDAEALDVDVDVDVDVLVEPVVDPAVDVPADGVDVVEEPRVELKAKISDDEEDVEIEDEHHPDDVEVALDVVLRERTKQASLADDDDEESDDEETASKTSVTKAETFVCSSCYFVKPVHQLVDDKNNLCVDCA